MAPALTRRQFLARSSSAALVARLPGWQAPPAASRMFISQNGAVAPRTAWPESARLAARVGYGGIDWPFGPAKEAGLDKTRALLAELKLRPTIASVPMTAGVMFGPTEAFRAALPQLGQDAAFAAGIGCQNMMLVLTPQSAQPRDERRVLVRDRLAEVGQVLAQHQVRLGLEFLGPLCMRSQAGCPAPARAGGAPAGPAAPENAPPPAPTVPTAPAAPVPRIPFVWTLPDTVTLARDSGPNIGVVLDIWHWYHSGGTVADILATDPGRIVHVHLSDARPMPAEDVRDNMRLMPGEGSIDTTGFLRALARIGYAGGVAPEPLGRIAMDMAPEDASRLGYETTLAAMTRAGVL